jgi:hypothetical protein
MEALDNSSEESGERDEYSEEIQAEAREFSNLVESSETSGERLEIIRKMILLQKLEKNLGSIKVEIDINEKLGGTDLERKRLVQIMSQIIVSINQVRNRINLPPKYPENV